MRCILHWHCILRSRQSINFTRLQRTRETAHRLYGQSRNREYRFIIDPNISTEHFVLCLYSERALSAELHHPFLNHPPGKRGNEFQLPALANIRSTSPTRDATDSKSRRFLETSANPTHVPRGCGTLWFRDLPSSFCYARWKSPSFV